MTVTAKCDFTGQTLDLNEGELVADRETGEWFFCSPDALDRVPNREGFPIVFKRIHDQVDLIDLLAHLDAKYWFNPVLFFEKIRSLKPY